MKTFKKAFLVMLCFAMIFSTTACGARDDKKDNNMTNDATDNRDNTVDDNGANNIGNSIENGVDNMGNAIDDGMDAVGDGIDNITNDMTDSNNSDKNTNKNHER